MVIDRIKSIIYNQLLTYRYAVGKVKRYKQGVEKPIISKLLELLSWQFRENDFNAMYYAFGLNLKGNRNEDYIGRREFLSVKNKVERSLKERAGCGEFNYDVATKDKFITNSIFLANSISCIENKALYSHRRLVFRDGHETGIEGFREFSGTFIIKNTVLEAGEGVMVCSITQDAISANGNPYSFDAFFEKLGNLVWVVQTLYTSSKEIRKVNSSALNSARIVTILNGDEPEYLCGFQAFATGGATTDSWSKGSVYVGIDIENEKLKAHGYCNLSEKERSLLTHHPDSGIEFEGYPLPGLKDALVLCLKAHKLLYFNFAIGWDVAITDQGPVIVEANEKPGMNVAQCTDGGLRKKIKQLATKLLEQDKRKKYKEVSK